MNKQQALYEQYIQFKEAKKVQREKSMKESLQIALVGALPSAIAAIALIIQEPVALKILGFILWAVVFGIIGFIACKILVLDQQKFQAGTDWENAFKGYLTECGVDVDSAEFPYHHYASYIRHGGGPVSTLVVYWTKAKVNGVPSSVDVQELGGKLLFSPLTLNLLLPHRNYKTTIDCGAGEIYAGTAISFQTYYLAISIRDNMPNTRFLCSISVRFPSNPIRLPSLPPNTESIPLEKTSYDQ